MEASFMPRTTAQWTISLPPALSREAEKMAKMTHCTRSDFVRRALRDYLAREKLLWQARVKLARKLDAEGVKTLEDVERMIDEGRQ
jgi:predicted transcriptional regulator